jgi:hypothetical protein
MLVNHMGEAVFEHIDHIGCRTKVKMDELWECMADALTRSPDLITYGRLKYCVHKDHIGFEAGAERRIDGATK